WTYATIHMSPLDDEPPLELHMFSSTQDRSLVELLTITSFYHQKRARLNLNHTINFGRPWQGKSACEYGFISLPYLDGPDLENFTDEEITVKCYWLIPVCESEVDYRSKYGTEALEEKFDQECLDYVNPNRDCIV
ncbi:suppressor of fused domain protein, partial [Fulvivirga kasyanovii]